MIRIDREAAPFAAVLVVVTGGVWLWSPWAALAPALLLAFTLNFFRDPDRTPPPDPGVLLAPADGRVIVASSERVSIFMNVLDVHVCRTPWPGKLVSVDHRSGSFLAAWKDGASEHNERLELVVEGAGARVRFTLVAGLVARRIVTRVVPGDVLVAGQRVGLIRFGSRVDVDLPEGSRLRVAVGERTVAGRTILASRDGGS